MCGIAGFVGADLDRDEATAKLLAMASALSRRGPDDEGLYIDTNEGVGLVHRRLSIIDLSPSGHQPMASPDGRYVITYNGEIYNFEVLRRDLIADGSNFVGTSDTEVLLHAILKWGLVGALTRAIGMFAFGLWDRRDRVLYLARDRLGEKPLYMVRLKRGLAFASELSAIRNAGLADSRIDSRALALYLKYAYVPAPYAIHVDSSKLLPGSILAVTADGQSRAPLKSWKREGSHGGLGLFTTKYWDLHSVRASHDGVADSRSDAAIQDEFDDLLRQSVVFQRRADVPVGAFLSGGIDSSLICSVAQSVTSDPVKTFTMGFENTLFDESEYADAVASRLGTDHTCVEVSADDVLKWVPRISEICDEPFADPSQLPTFLVSRIARSNVKVCLTGDGGDELFGGYNRYIEPVRVHRYASKLPEPLSRLIAAVLRRIPAGAVDRLLEALSRYVGSKRMRVQSPGKKLHKLADTLATSDPRALYDILMSHWQRPGELLDRAMPQAPFMEGPDAKWDWESFAENAMLWDLEHYLPDNNLTKVDRASMAVSLETRLPLLDHRIVEFAVNAPIRAKIANGSGKIILRKALSRYLPADLIERPKMGFSVPVAAWLRGPLREWAEDMLSQDTIARVGLFDPAQVRRCWLEHISGRRDHYQKLWLIVVAHTWQLSVSPPGKANSRTS